MRTTITPIAILAAAAVLSAAPEPKPASIDTAKGATIALKKNRDGIAEAFVFRAIDDPKQEAQVALPSETDKLKKILFACLPRSGRDGLEAIRIIPSGSAEFRGLASVRTVKTRRFETTLPFLLEPVYRKEAPDEEMEDEDRAAARPRLSGFRFTATVGKRPAGPAGIQETGKQEGKEDDGEDEPPESSSVKHKGLLLEIPDDADPGFRYGVKLTPVWKEAGKTIGAFDVELVSVPRPRPPVR